MAYARNFFKAKRIKIKHKMLEVLRWMHEKEEVAQQQKHGVIVCNPKTPHPVYEAD
jgi:hypothetical protein